jgi:endoglycosylceramidase
MRISTTQAATAPRKTIEGTSFAPTGTLRGAAYSGDSGVRSRRIATLRAVATIAALLIVGTGCIVPSPPRGPVGGSPAAIHADGRWFVDAHGRVIGMRGVNFVQKFPPVTPASVGFDDEDAEFLANEGFNVVRLGVVFGAVMPAPGVIDREYVDGIAHTTRVLARHGIYVQLDFHQDGYGPAVHGNGFPEWATLTDGLPNPPAQFPLYYVQNPALQRAFDNFWANRPGPDGVPLQTHYAAAIRAIAAEVAHEPYVLGYDLMNEPWPGANWSPCLTGCPDIERERLIPFARRMTDAIRTVDRAHIVFSEPFTLFNFGQATTVVPPGDRGDGLSFHVYTTSPADEPAVIEHVLDAAGYRDAPPIASEFGATSDPATITRITSTIEHGLVPWVFWSYDENLVVDKSLPPEGANVRTPTLQALARPYAAATNGTPTSWSYDATSGSVEFTYSTRLPDGRRGSAFTVTEIDLPLHAFRSGYRVSVTGARVVSHDNAPTLVLRNERRATAVQVHIERV